MNLFFLIINLFVNISNAGDLFRFDVTIYPSLKKTTFTINENGEQKIDIGEIADVTCKVFREADVPHPSGGSYGTAMLACSDLKSNRDWEVPLICIKGAVKYSGSNLMLNNKKDKKGFKIMGECPRPTP